MTFNIKNKKIELRGDSEGFTLIELLIVMAILGVLAVVVLVAINPVQQLARTRDAGRKSGIAQMGRSLEAFYTSHGGSYLDNDALWLTNLVLAGEISTVPSGIGYSAGDATKCGSNVVSNWCYDVNSDFSAAVAYTRLESDSEISKCDSGSQAFFIWSTKDGRGGLICPGDEGGISVGIQTWNLTQ